MASGSSGGKGGGGGACAPSSYPHPYPPLLCPPLPHPLYPKPCPPPPPLPSAANAPPGPAPTPARAGTGGVPRTPPEAPEAVVSEDLRQWTAPLRTTIEVVLGSRGCREAATWRRTHREVVRTAEARFVDPNASQS